MHLREYRNALLEFVTDAGRILLSHFGKIKQVRHKEHPSSVVCEADLASEKSIVRAIRKRFPKDGIIAEESGLIPGSSEFTWVIDPLDGTSNFVAGLPWFGAQVGLLQGHQPVLGAMCLPVSADLYWAQKGQGTFKNRRRLRLPSERNLRNVLCAFGFDATGGLARTRRNARLLMAVAAAVRNTRATNSLIDFCYTLEGGFGACLNLNCKIWDIIPVAVMIPEAGGKFTDLAGRQLRFIHGQAGLTTSYEILGAGRGLHPQLVRVLKSA